MKSLILGFMITLSSLVACVDTNSIWRDQTLPSGKTIKVASFHLTWGVEHNERYPGNDCFSLEFVSANPKADPKSREKEALEIFELIRPISEQWGLNTASLSGFKTTQRKGGYDLFSFNRGSDGKWSCKLYSAKIFTND